MGLSQQALPNSSVPTCCGVRMHVKLEFSRFVELGCKQCGDVAYIKLHSTAIS